LKESRRQRGVEGQPVCAFAIGIPNIIGGQDPTPHRDFIQVAIITGRGRAGRMIVTECRIFSESENVISDPCPERRTDALTAVWRDICGTNSDSVAVESRVTSALIGDHELMPRAVEYSGSRDTQRIQILAGSPGSIHVPLELIEIG